MRVRELIDDKEYLESKKVLLAEKASLELNRNTDRQKASLDQTKEDFVFASEAVKRFRNGTPEEKKSILENLGSHFSLKDKILSIEAKKPFQMIEKLLRVLAEKNAPVPLDKFSFITSQNGPQSPYFPLGWTLIHDVRTFYEEEVAKEEIRN